MNQKNSLYIFAELNFITKAKVTLCLYYCISKFKKTLILIND